MASIGSGIRVVLYDGIGKLIDDLDLIMFETVTSFGYLTSCISFIQQNAADNRVTVVVTTDASDDVLEKFERLDPVEAVLVYSSKKQTNLHALPSKVTGIYSKYDALIQSLMETLNNLEMQLDANSLLFQRDEKGLQNSHFYFFDLWKRYGANQSNSNKNNLVDQARTLFRRQPQIRSFFGDFRMNYKSSNVLYWLDKYTHPFPYYLLVCNALRTHDQQILSIVRFFVLDLSKQMKPLPVSASSNQVYFGTKLPIAIVDRLEQKTAHDVVAFQCFLATTKSRMNALRAATRPSRRRKIANVLFKIDATHSLCATLADTLLIDMSTPFYITRVTRNTGFGGVQELVTVVSLVALPKQVQNEYLDRFIVSQKKQGKSINDFINQTIPLIQADNSYDKDQDDKSDISKMALPLYLLSVPHNNADELAVSKQEAEGDELLAMGNYAQAADAYEQVKNPNVRVLNKHGCLLRERLQDPEGALDRHREALEKASDRGRVDTYIYLGLAHYDLSQYPEALQCYTQALRIVENDKYHDPSTTARCLSGMGNVYWAQKDYDQALSCAQRALMIRENEVRPRNDLDTATSLGNVANILHDKGDIDNAMVYAKRAIDLLSVCAEGDRRLAAAWNNLGAMHQSQGDYIHARECYEFALKCTPEGNQAYQQITKKNIALLDELEHKKKTSVTS